jgi:hypothetical protein
MGDMMKQMSESLFPTTCISCMIIDQGCFTPVTGKKVTYRQISYDDYLARMGSGTPDRIKQEIVDQFQYGDEFGCACSLCFRCNPAIKTLLLDYNGKSVIPSQQHLARKPHTWADFVKATDLSKVLV